MGRVGSVRCLAWWLGVLVLITAVGATTLAQLNPNAPSTAVGHFLPPRGAMPLIGIPTSDQQAVRGTAERLWAIVLRNPTVKRPTGFNLRPSLIGHGYALPNVPRDVPYTCSASGYLYWYYVNPVHNRVEALSVSDHAFFVHANRLSVVFSGGHQWHSDAAGQMYWEPREMRRVGGYPQYANGVVVVTNTSRPLWAPVPRERLLRWELDTQRAALESAIATARTSASYDPQASLDAWLRERPQRQRANDELYETTKKRDPKLAEEIRAKLAKAEQGTEETLRENIVRHAKDRPFLLRQFDQRREESETCVRYLEDELKRLSAAERAAPGYVSTTTGSTRLPAPGCSAVVDAGVPGAARIVEPNWAFFDRSLPRTAVQAILIDFGNFHLAGFDRVTWKQRVYEGLRDGMDYQALAAMLAKR